MKLIKDILPPRVSRAETAFLIFLSASIATILAEPQYNNPFLGLMFISWLFIKKKDGAFSSAAKDPWVLIGWGFFLVYLLGMIYTDNVPSGWSQIETKLGFLAFPFLFSSYGGFDKTKKNFVHSVLTLCLLAIALFCLFVAFQLSYEKTGSLVDLDSSFFVYNQLTFVVFLQPLYFSLFILFVMVVWQNRLLDDWNEFSQWEKRFWVAVQIFFLVFLFLLSSRMSILAYMAWAILRTAVLFVKRKKRVLAVGLIAVEFLVGLVLLTQIDVNKTRFSEAVNPESNYETDRYAGRSLRIEKWKCSFETWQQSPVFGVGTGDENDELLKCFKAKEIHSAVKFGYNSHNQYLSTLTQVGILGLILLLAMVLYPIYMGFKNKDLTILGIGLIFFLCIGSETMLSRRFGVLYCVLIMSVWLVGLNGSEKRNIEIEDSQPDTSSQA